MADDTGEWVEKAVMSDCKVVTIPCRRSTRLSVDVAERELGGSWGRVRLAIHTLARFKACCNIRPIVLLTDTKKRHQTLYLHLVRLSTVLFSLKRS